MRTGLVILAVFCQAACLEAADTLLNLNTGWLISFNPQQGSIVQWHSHVISAYPQTLAWDPASRTVYFTSYPHEGVEVGVDPFSLYAVNADTLQVSTVARITGTASGALTSTAFDSRAGVLYGIDSSYADIPSTTPVVSSSTLYRIDTVTGIATPVAVFAAPGLSAISYDGTAGALYGLTASNSAPAIVRVDPGNATTTTLYQLNSPFTQLAVIPGTLSFYSLTNQVPSPVANFVLIDAAAGTVKLLATAYTGGGTLLYQNFDLAPETVPISGPLSYTIADLCYPVSCAATVLNDSGVVAGVSSDIGNPVFLAGGGRGLSTIPGSEGFVPASLNNRGDIAGAIAPQSASPEGMLFSGSTGQLYSLPAPATHINNLGDITSQSATIYGIPFVYLSGLNDSGVAFGQVEPHTGVIASPGGALFETAWVIPEEFNNAGQTLMFLQGYYAPQVTGLIGGLGVYSPGSGIRIVDASGISESGIGFNDSGLALVSEGDPDTELLDTSGSIPELGSSRVPLHYFVPVSSGWSRLLPIALNNYGQIAVQAVNSVDGRDTTILLTPDIPSIPADVLRPPSALRVPFAGCGARSVDGQPFECGPAQHKPRLGPVTVARTPAAVR